MNSINASQWVDSASAHYDRLHFHNNTVTASQKLGVFVFGTGKINQSFRFSFRLNKSTDTIGIGIADKKYNNSKYMTDQHNWLRYYNNGQLYVSGVPTKIQGKGFKAGQKITVQGNLKEGTIQWLVDGEHQCSYNWEVLKDKNVEWVPFVFLHNNEDSVSIEE